MENNRKPFGVITLTYDEENDSVRIRFKKCKADETEAPAAPECAACPYTELEREWGVCRRVCGKKSRQGGR